MATRAWIPTDATSATLVGWFDVSNTSSLTFDSTTGNVTKMRSLVGGWEITAPASANYVPYSATGYNNLPALLPSNDNHWLSGPAPANFPTGSAAGTMSGIAAYLVRRGDYTTLHYYGSANQNKARSISATGEMVSTGYYGNDVTGNVKWTGFDRIFVSSITTTGLATQWVDGGSAQTVQKNVLSTPTTSTFWLLRSINGDAWKNPYQESHHWAGILSDDDRQKLAGYLAWKWNKVDQLPADQPYKTAAPTVSDGGSGIAPDTASQATSSTTPILAARSVVQSNSATQPTVSTSPAASARTAIQPDSVSQASASTSPSLATAGAVLPDSAAQASTSTSPAVAARTSVASDSAAQASSSTSPVAAPRGSVQASNVAQAQASTSPQIAPTGSVMPDYAVQASASTSPALSTRTAITPASAAQAVTSTSPAIGARGAVAPDAGQQTTSSTSPALQARSAVTPSSATQGQTASTPQIAARSAVSPNSASQAQSAASPILFVGARPLPPSSRTVRTNPASRLVTSPRPSRLAA